MRPSSRSRFVAAILALALVAPLGFGHGARADDDDEETPPQQQHPKGYYEVCQHQKDAMDCYRIFEDCTRRWQVRDAEGAAAPCNVIPYAECRNLLSIMKKRAETLSKMSDSDRDADPSFRLACRGYTLFTPGHFYVTCPAEHKRGYKMMSELGELLRMKCR